jgi:hypothetical protein
MAEIKYLSGVENARIAYFKTDGYIPVACITSATEDNNTRTSERVNTCTDGDTVKTVDGFDRTVSFDGEATDQDSYDELEELFNSGEQQFFRTNKSGTNKTDAVKKYFKGVISSLSRTATAGEKVTFSASVELNGTYMVEAPAEAPETVV